MSNFKNFDISNDKVCMFQASIFKKQYYVNTFLPSLLYSEGVIEGKEELVAALKKAKKVQHKLHTLFLNSRNCEHLKLVFVFD